MPYTEISTREKWLYDNEKTLESVKQGLKDAQANLIFEKGSFAEYIDNDYTSPINEINAEKRYANI